MSTFKIERQRLSWTAMKNRNGNKKSVDRKEQKFIEFEWSLLRAERPERGQETKSGSVCPS